MSLYIWYNIQCTAGIGIIIVYDNIQKFYYSFDAETDFMPARHKNSVYHITYIYIVYYNIYLYNII